jgi:hypothetical protein
LSSRSPFLIVAGVLASMVLAAAPAGAATNKCARYTAKYSVVQQSRAAVVYENADRLAYACLFSDGRLRRLPGPDGFDTYVGQTYTLTGNYVAYGVVNQEPAASIYTAAVYVVDLRTGKPTVRNQNAYPVDLSGGEEFSFDVASISLTSKGAVAWLTDASINDAQSLVVRRVGKKVTVLDRGTDVRPGSFAHSSDGKTVYWTRGSTVKSAPLS